MGDWGEKNDSHMGETSARACECVGVGGVDGVEFEGEEGQDRKERQRMMAHGCSILPLKTSAFTGNLVSKPQPINAPIGNPTPLPFVPCPPSANQSIAGPSIRACRLAFSATRGLLETFLPADKLQLPPPASHPSPSSSRRSMMPAVSKRE